MSKFPLTFEVIADATEGTTNPWKCSADALDPINMAIPVEVNGPGKAYSPEDLFGLAVLNCIIAVYKNICEKNSLNFKKIEGKLIVKMDKVEGNSQVLLTHLEITFNITGASDKEKARELLERAMKMCPVSNSIKSGKTCHITVE